MYNPATVVYIKDQSLKEWLRNLATANHESISSTVVRLMRNAYNSKKKNKISKYFGAANKSISKEDQHVFEEILKQNKLESVSKSEKLYTDLF
jgi:hypothetical protein